MRVPAPQLPGVAPSGAPAPTMNIAASPADFGALQGGAEEGLGRTIGAAADAGERQAVFRAQLDNEAAAKDVYANQFAPTVRKILSDPETGFYAKRGKDALDAWPDVQQQIDQARKDTLNSLPNLEQRRLFTDVSLRRQELELDSASRYVTDQRRVYRDQMSDGLVSEQQQDAIANYNDPKRFDLALRSGTAEIEGHAQDNGQPASLTAEHVRKFRSSVYAGAVQRQALTDPVGALDFYRKNQDQIDGSVRLELETHLKSAVYPVQSRQVANAVMSGRAMPDMDRLVNAVIGKESGGVADAVSGKGAEGLMQLMPDTAREVAAKLNLPFDEEKLKTDPAYNRTLGTEYLNEMLRRYGGSQTLALAAYNAGPGNVDKWVAQNGNPALGEISEADWIKKIPFTETQNYVTEINGKAPQVAGTAPTSKDVRDHLADWLGKADDAAAKFSPDPVFRDMVRTHILSYSHEIEQGQAYKQKQSRDMLMGIAMGLGKQPDGTWAQLPSQQRPTSLEALLATPQARDAWETMDSIGQHGLMSLVTQNAKGESPPLTPQAWAKYYELKGIAARDPVAFGNQRLDSADIIGTLPHSMTKELMDEQARQQSSQGKLLTQGERIADVQRVSRELLMAAKIPMPKKEGDKAAQYDQYVGRFLQQSNEFIATNKRKPSDDELRTMGKALLTEGLQRNSGWLWDNSARLYQVPPGSFYVNVPKDQAPMVHDALFKELGHEPSPGEMQEWWTRWTLAQAKAAK